MSVVQGVSSGGLTQRQDEACRACGHRELLHGDQYARGGRWCIAWDGAKFCGCTVHQ